MRRTFFAATAFVLAVIAFAGQGVGQSAEATAPGRTPESGKFVVHEWGTFTSFSGSDGVRLEFRPLVDDDLPAFVLDRYLQSGFPNFSKSTVRSRMRMETPVTYFYTDHERDVDVQVAFPDGLLTEFYPPVERMQPDYNFGDRPPLKDSLLDWGRVHLIPTDRFKVQVDDSARRELLEAKIVNGLLPQADSKKHYLHARETDSAIVEVRRVKSGPNDPPYVPQGQFFEKFLFYRGIGNFDLPLKLSALPDGKFELVNTGADPIRSLFLVDIFGDKLQFSRLEAVPANGRLVVKNSTKRAPVEKLESAVVAALMEEGLYEKESRAMVKTWKSSWFGEQGTRLFYSVPRSITDKFLPLTISPAPDETVRVLIGRMEIMTPEEESRVTDLVRLSAAKRVDAILQAQKSRTPFQFAWLPELKQLGRLAEPALIRVSKISDDPNVRAEARMLLKTLDQRQ